MRLYLNKIINPDRGRKSMTTNKCTIHYKFKNQTEIKK